MLKKLFSKKNSAKTEAAKPNPQSEALAENAFQTALQHHQKGDFAQAEAFYRQILQHDPTHVNALHFSGVLAYQMGQNQAAIELMRKAISIHPTEYSIYCNLGLALHTQGQLDEAVNSYRHALALQPNFVEARSNLGNALLAQNKMIEAIASYRYALILNPDNDVLTQQLDYLLKLNPDIASKQTENSAEFLQAKMHYDFGVLCHSQWKLAQAAESYKKALGIKLDYIEAYLNLGLVFKDQCKMDDAIQCFQFVLSLKPDYAPAYYNLGIVFFLLGNLSEASESYQKALGLQSVYPEATNMLFHTQLRCCDWSTYAVGSEKILNSILAGKQGYRPFLFLAISQSPSVQQQCAYTYATHKYQLVKKAVIHKQRYSHEKIRIAYVSDDFREHAVSYLMAGLFEQHDKERFEIIAISLNTEDSSSTGLRVKNAFKQFIDVSELGNDEVAALMQDMEIDIAVDLTGFTSYNRTGIFTYRPAPVQVNYLGYPATMGAEYIDYIIADKYLIPPEQQGYYTEKVVYLPDCFQANDDKKRISEKQPSRLEMGLPETGFVFCSFNNSYKITPVFFALWMRLLKAVPESVLWLIADNAMVQQNLRNEAVKAEIDPERLIFASRLAYSDYLARFTLADLFLDTLPFNAGTTASDALWAGVPVITCSGEAFASRMAGSLLTAIGLPELITRDLKEYEALALKLATTATLCAEIRSKLAQNRTIYPLFNTDRFRRHIEAAYIKMWEKNQRGELPASFSVQPIASGEFN